MGLFKRKAVLTPERVLDEAAMLDDAARRMKIQTGFIWKLNDEVAPVINLFAKYSDDNAFEEYYKRRPIYDIRSFEVLYYPLSEEESKTMGEEYETLYQCVDVARSKFNIFAIINAAYFYLRDKYGLAALNEPPELDLSSALQMFMYEKYINTLASVIMDEDKKKDYDPSDKPVTQIYDWGLKYVFMDDAKFAADLPEIKKYIRKQHLYGDDYFRVLTNFQNFAVKKSNEYTNTLITI